MHRQNITLAFQCLAAAALLLACQPEPRPDERPVDLPRDGALAGQPARTADLPLKPGADQPPLPSSGGDIAARLVGDWPEHSARIDMQVQRVPVRGILDELARRSRLNFVPADDLRCQVTLALTQQPWVAVLDAALTTCDLVAVKEGNVVRVLRRNAYLDELRRSSK
ncbi:MAG: hypothetical protein JXR96_18555 [Deltaproteobacteria bacterium]|nr:hypothetical protein [Deltaproteobacteria bacterium]